MSLSIGPLVPCSRLASFKVVRAARFTPLNHALIPKHRLLNNALELPSSRAESPGSTMMATNAPSDEWRRSRANSTNTPGVIGQTSYVAVGAEFRRLQGISPTMSANRPAKSALVAHCCQDRIRIPIRPHKRDNGPYIALSDLLLVMS
jgi:hypothetical protein